MALTAQDIIFQYIFPWVGVVIANFMYSAPFKDVREASMTGDLGHLNPLPWAFMTGNTYGWLTYGALKNDPSIVSGSIVGFLLSIWLNMQAVKLQYARSYSEEMRKLLLANKDNPPESPESPRKEFNDGKRHRTLLTIDELQESINSLMQSEVEDEEEQDVVHRSSFDLIVLNVHSSLQKVKTVSQQETVVLYVSALWLGLTLLISFANFGSNTNEFIVGITVNLNLIVFYGAPLSTIYTVINTHETKSIHVPTMMLNTLNAFFWTVYGFTKLDPFVIVPNGSGVLLGVVQISLCLLYPRYQPQLQMDDRLSNRRTIFLLPQHTIDIDDSRALARHSISSRLSLSHRGKMKTLIPDATFYQGKTERLWL